MSAFPVPLDASLQRLPLVTLYVTERCNSRCVTCDYWRHGRSDMPLESVERLLPGLRQLRTQVVLLSGGEPLLNPAWPQIADLLRSNGFKVWLLTSGLSLAKHAARAAALFHYITVSLDATDSETYAAIRGVDAFDKICEGVRAVASRGVPAGLRVTLQRANFRQLAAFVGLAKRIGARQVSFLAVDVSNPHAFGRTGASHLELALRVEDLALFEQSLKSLRHDHAEDFRSGFIAQSPEKLDRILQYFAARHGRASYPAVRCNAPEFSAVVGATGSIHPCFFIPGPPQANTFDTGAHRGRDFAADLNGPGLTMLREDIRRGARAECKTCVCSMWRDPEALKDAVRWI